MITKEQLVKITNKPKLVDRLYDSIVECLNKYEINTTLRICNFLAQVLHESGCFTYQKENLNYSAAGLLKIFPKYFTIELAKQYERNPERIANKVYANRMGNGNENSGDGYKFCGKGFIQITGKDNYTQISKDLGVDFIKDSELLSSDKYSVLSAGWFWNSRKLNILADKDDILLITKKINGGTIGLEDRKNWYEKCKSIIV